jgi:peptidoglycan/xylan/chitin deacetylase (PgdA/CDA1 family)
MAAAMAWAVRGRSATVFAPSIWHGDRTRPQVALTFDDGPSESTPELLDILDEFQVKATFFVCGRNVQRLPEIVRKTMAAGHEIGNHSWSHRRLDFASYTTIREEVGRTQQIISEVTGCRPLVYRAPFGVRWYGLGRVQREFGLRGVMWTTLGLDWKHNADQVAGRVLRRMRGGDIVCLHDGRELRPNPDIRTTCQAVRQIIPRVFERNLAFVKASEMLRS